MGELDPGPKGLGGARGWEVAKEKGGEKKRNPKSNATGVTFDSGPKSFNARFGTWVKFLVFSPKVVSSNTRTNERWTNERWL